MKLPFVQFLISRGEIPGGAANRISQRAVHNKEPIGMIAVDHGLIVGHQIDEILDRQRHSKLKFGELAVEMDLLTQEKVQTLLQIQQFRTLARVMEALALANVLSLPAGVLLLLEFASEQPGECFTERTTAGIG